ncbi:efflux RND transporter periplasmic adaptor subunit [Marinibacterium profundimaris]|uniref:efflux RND transporter periplasmic adaptor subunit n=1 Tax=Marinibacterium profundimaris TaxID=1679460 RepID=UPI001303A4B9|nr:efflux RND transporter periplasmic adaptor subunit [Marinibacterium profundimaris]
MGLGALLLAGAPALAQDQQAAQAPRVGTVAVESRDVAQTAQFTGRVRAVDRVDVLPRVSGFLLSIGFDEGSAVTEGQTLFEIQPDAYQAAITQIQGQIKAAEAAKKLADIQVDRQQQLVTDNVAAENVLQEAQAKQGQAQGELEQLQGELQNAQLNLSYTTMAAPFDGRVGLTEMSVGTYVSEATGAMVTVSSIDPIYVDFPVAEARLLNFLGHGEADAGDAAGQGASGSGSASGDTSSGTAATGDDSAATDAAASSDSGSDTTAGGTADGAAAASAAADASMAAPVSTAPLAVSITLANGRGYGQDGTVKVVDTQVQPGTDTILVRASFPNPDGVLRDGQLVQVTLTQDTGADSLVIPASALQRDQGGYFVLLVGDKDVVEKRSISVGRMAGTEVVVADGLKVGEQVITEGVQRARPGQPVTPQAAGAQPTTPQGTTTSGGSTAAPSE